MFSIDNKEVFIFDKMKKNQPKTKQKKPQTILELLSGF